MKTYLLTVTGLVQGIGMRPSVCILGRELGLNGIVRNSGGVLEIEVNLESWAVEDFIHRLYKLCPGKAQIDNIDCKEISLKSYEGFSVENSNSNSIIPALPYDYGMCEDCRNALTDSKNRRYRYPFITCASCGPRYTLMRKIPYDRSNTSMSEFEMCEDCKREYYDPKSRYFYAQTLSCPKCGPELVFYNTSSRLEKVYGEKAYEKALAALKAGYVVAVKNVGGFHFVCDASLEKSVDEVRKLKKRPKKPLAVCFADIEKAREYAGIDGEMQKALCSDARPIVLCEKGGKSLPENVCVNSDKVGVMLPANALQYMLAKEFDAIVMTSANISAEPIIINDDDLQEFDNLYVLSNNREILTPVDDSIIQKKCGRLTLLRRARGYVPEAINVDLGLKKTVLLTGADMKGSIGLAKGDKLFLSQCLGNMEYERVFSEALATIDRFEKNHNLMHEVVVGDAHPDYYSGKLVRMDECVYHHEAHAASVIVEHNLINEKLLAFSFDGTGYGSDGSIWGGEVFLYENKRFERVSSIKPFKVAGGNATSYAGRLTLASIATAALIENSHNADIVKYVLAESGLDETENELIKKALERGIGCFTTSSMGRLFDAVSALLDICKQSTYEGEAAIELEYAARKAEQKEANWGYDDLIENGKLSSKLVIEYLAQKKKNGTSVYTLAYEFHCIVAYWMLKLIKQYALGTVVFAGGVAANELLLSLVEESSKELNVRFYFNEQLPPGDDGIALGQLGIYALSHENKED